MKPKEVRSLLCLESECKFDNGCGCLDVLAIYRHEIIEECAKAAESFKDYTGAGTEDRNDLIGMFGRGNRNARTSIAATIRSLSATRSPPCQLS